MGGQAVNLGLERVDLFLVARLGDCLGHRLLGLGQKLVRLQIGPADLPNLFHHRLGDCLLLDGVAGTAPRLGEPLVSPADEIQFILPCRILPVQHRQQIAALCQSRLKKWEISTEEIGDPVYPLARRKLAEHGISCEGKAARRLTNADYDQYNLLIGMDWANLRNMRRICGGDFAGKRHLLKDYTDHPGDVADPWYTDDFDTTWWDVLAGCKGLLQAPKMQPGTGKRNTAA